MPPSPECAVGQSLLPRGWVPWGCHWDWGGGLCSPSPHPTVGWGLWGGSAQPGCPAWLRFPVWLISTQLS